MDPNSLEHLTSPASVYTQCLVNPADQAVLGVGQPTGQPRSEEEVSQMKEEASPKLPGEQSLVDDFQVNYPQIYHKWIWYIQTSINREHMNAFLALLTL